MNSNAVDNSATGTRKDRARAALVGLAVGDALGTTVEFEPPGSFEPLTDVVGGGPFKLEAGQWTDDTSMALCLAESLIETNGFDPHDQMERYCQWWKQGYYSSNGSCFDIGNTVHGALSRYLETGISYAGSTDTYSAGNGSLMRLAPVAMAFANRPVTAVVLAGESSRTTHGTRECVDACRYFAGLLVGLINGESKETVLAKDYSPLAGLWDTEPLAPAIAEIAGGSFKVKDPPDISGTGYVVTSLEAALWAFHRTSNYREAVLAAANLGNDADTTAAICGQIAGACYGVSDIPENWLNKLALKEEIFRLADGLIGMW